MEEEYLLVRKISHLNSIRKKIYWLKIHLNSKWKKNIYWLGKYHI